jgi:hypothetical protein
MTSFINTWKNSWLDSLAVFKADQLPLFLLVTLKTIARAYTILATYFWWLFIAYGAAIYFLHTTLPWVPQALSLFIVSLSFLVIRSSTQRKTFSYFLSYIVHDYEIMFLFFLIPYLIFSGVIAQWYTLFFVYLMFFVLDSGALYGERYGIFKSLYQTIIMLVSNAPLLCIVHGVFVLFFILLHAFLHIPLVYLTLLAPIPLSFFNNIYTKRVHEQLTFYV